MPFAIRTTYGAPTSGGGLIDIPGGPGVQLGPGQSYATFDPAGIAFSSWSYSQSSRGTRSGGGQVTGEPGPGQGAGGAGSGGGQEWDEWTGEEDVPAQPQAQGGGLLGLAIIIGALVLLSK